MTSPAQTSPAQTSPARTLPARTSPAQTSPAQTSPGQTSPAQTSPAQASPAQTSPAQTSPAQSSPVQTSPAQTSPAQTPPAQTSPAQTPPAQTSPAQTSPAQTLPTQTLPAQTSPAQTSPAQTSPAQTLPSQTPPAQTPPAQTSPAQNQPDQQHENDDTTYRQSTYKHGDPVWVKLEKWPWWPAKVIPSDECPLLIDPKRNVLACVHFPVENRYDVVYDKSKIQPWKDQTNSSLIRRRAGKFKHDPASLDLFNEVLGVLSAECGITIPSTQTPTVTKSKSLCQKQLSEAHSPKARPRQADTLDHHSSVLSRMEMVPKTPSPNPKCKTKPGSPPAGVFEPSAVTLLNGSLTTLSSPLRDRPGLFDTSTRWFDPFVGKSQKEDPVNKCKHVVQKKGYASASDEVLQSDQSADEKPDKITSRKRYHSSSSDCLSGTKAKSQRCVKNKFRPQRRTLSWDPNIEEDICDSKARPSEPATVSQPEPAARSVEEPAARSVEEPTARNEEEDSYDDDSGDDDLPEIQSFTSKDPIQRGALLWVKHQRYPFWPTVVRNCYSKRKTLQKVTVVFLGTQMNECTRGRPFTLRYNPKKMVPFAATDTAKHSQFKDEGLRWQGTERSFSDTIARVEDFLTKQGLGSAVSPFAFFADDIQQDKWGTGAYPLEEDDDHVSSQSSHGSEMLLVSGSEQEVKKERQDTGHGGSPDVSKEDLKEDEETLSPRIQSITARRQKRGERILAVIKSERMKKYLMDIYTEQQLSRRHAEFKADETNMSRTAMQASGFGPIDDDEQQLKILQLLGKYFQEATGKSMPNMSYVFRVWLPEAIIEALHITLKKGWDFAEATFLRGPRRLKEEKLLEHQSLVKSGRNIDPEDARRYRQRIEQLKSKFTSTGSLGGPS